MTPLAGPGPSPSEESRPPAGPPLRVDYARPGLRPSHVMSDLRIALVTVTVTVGAVAALAAGLSALAGLVWAAGRLVRGE